VVDRDNVNLRIIIRKLQRELNCRAFGFSSPETCLVAMERREPDLVLSDCGSSDQPGEYHGMNSEQLLLEIKKDFSDVPVIMYTSISSMELAVNMMRAGASNFIPKQVFFFQKIVQAVQEEINHITDRYKERRTKFRLLMLVGAVVAITLFFNFNRQEWLMYFMLASLMAASFFIFWERKQPAAGTDTSLHDGLT
jgi:DNA-binding NtrC family response regulator